MFILRVHVLRLFLYLVAVIGPGAKGEVALLPVKGEVGDIHHTCALCDGGRVPDDLSIVTKLYIGGRRA